MIYRCVYYYKLYGIVDKIEERDKGFVFGCIAGNIKLIINCSQHG